MKNSLNPTFWHFSLFLGILLFPKIDTINAQCSPDVTPPTASCKNSTLYLNSSGVGAVAVNQVNNGSFDNCPGALNFSVNPTGFNCTMLGDQTVTLTVTDAAGLSSTCSATVEVTYFEAPDITCTFREFDMPASGVFELDPIDLLSSLNFPDCYIYSGEGFSIEAFPSTFDCSMIGANTVGILVTDNFTGLSDNCVGLLFINDPDKVCCDGTLVANCADATVQLNATGNGSISPGEIGGASEADCGVLRQMVSPKNFNCTKVGFNTVTYTVTDVLEFSATCTATVTVEDNVPPVANCQDATVLLDANGNGTLAETAINSGSTDACGLANVAVSPTSFTCADLGDQSVTLEVTDNNGNSSTCTAIAKVEDNEPPVAICLDPTVYFNGEDEITIAAVEVFDEANSTDNCSSVHLLDISPTSVTCDQLGTTVPVMVSIADGVGNPNDCIANMTVAGFPCGWSFDPNGINCPNGSTASFDPATETFRMTSESCYDPYFYSPTDSHGFIGTELCGDGEIIAQVTSVVGNGWGGITMRETDLPGAKMLQLMIDGTYLTMRELRQTTGGIAYSHLFARQGKNWLRLTRSGDTFGAYHSLDGTNWDPVLVAFVPMANCIDIGLITANKAPFGTVTAEFDNVVVIDAIPLVGENNTNTEIQTTLGRNIELYPNPSSGEVFVSLQELMGEQATIRVFNGLGQLLEMIEIDEIQLPTQRLDLQQYQDGVYMINVQSKDFEETKKLMLNR